MLSMETAPKVVDGPPKGVVKAPTACALRVCTVYNEILMLYSAYGSSRSLEDLQDYGQRLLAIFPSPDAADVRIKVPHEVVSPDSEREREGDGGVLTGCREAVEILTRNPRKGEFHVWFGLGWRMNVGFGQCRTM